MRVEIAAHGTGIPKRSDIDRNADTQSLSATAAWGEQYIAMRTTVESLREVRR